MKCESVKFSTGRSKIVVGPWKHTVVEEITRIGHIVWILTPNIAFPKDPVNNGRESLHVGKEVYIVGVDHHHHLLLYNQNLFCCPGSTGCARFVTRTRTRVKN